MIYDRCFEYEELKNFLLRNDQEFMTPLSETLKRFQTNIEDYARKLCTKGTIACQKHNNEICCTIIGYTNDLPEDNGSYITQVMTDPKYRNQGIATKLLKEYIYYCQKKKISYIWLTTEAKNYRAQRVYEGVGFYRVDIDDSRMVRYEYALTE